MEYIAPLTSRALICLNGSDAEPFLQNLITCDVDKLAVGEATFGALLTPQGKILFDFYLLKQTDHFVIDVEAESRDALAKRLTFYKLRADVGITLDDRAVFVGWGETAARGVIDPRHAGLGWRLYEAELDTTTDEAAWNSHRIRLGIPQSGIDFELAALFPHDALMDQWQHGGVDFSKGCYVGQEVVSRMQHRGTARNRFVMVSSQQPLPSQLAGSELKSEDKKIGTMGSTDGSAGLALVRIDRAAAAMTAGQAIVIDGVEVELARPEFASFDWPS